MYKIGFCEREITPFFGHSIAGYFSERLVDGIKDKTYAKATVVEKNGELIALLAIDACMVSEATCEAIYGRVSKYVNLKKENLLIAATHSHTAGPGNIDGEDSDFDIFYLKWLSFAAADTVITAYQSMRPARLKFACGEVKDIAFVRNFLLKDNVCRTNPGRLNTDIISPIGNPDESLPVIFAETESGELLGAVYSFACHQDCVESCQISGDYSSQVAIRMKEKYGMNFVSIYFSGTAGNVNEVNVGLAHHENPNYYRIMGDKIADELISLQAKSKEIDAPLDVAYGTKLYECRVPTPKEIADFKAFYESVELPEGIVLEASAEKKYFDACMAKRAVEFAKSEKKYREIKMQVMKLGKLMIFALPGEVFTQYGEKIKASFPDNDCFFACLANNDWSYMPAKECYQPELYESLYGSAHFYPDDVADIFDEIIKLGKSL